MTKEKKPTLLNRFIVTFGLLIFFSGVLIRYHNQRVLSFSSDIPQVQAEPITPSLSRVRISSIGIDLSVETTRINEGVWEIPKSGAGHLDTSAYPLQNSNIVIYAHNRPGLFENLTDVEVGDRIFLTDETGQIFPYEVSDTQIVKPTQIEVVFPTNFEVLTLYTCTGPFDSQRFVVRAFPFRSADYSV